MLKAEVLQNNVIVIKDNAVSDSIKFETVSFNFPKSWNGFKKTAVFISKDKEVFNVVLDEGNSLCLNETECFIPHEVLKAPSFELSVFGVKDDKVATATPAYVKVLKSGFAEGSEPSEPTPDEYQQLINLAEDTRQIAQSVRDDADNGLFGGATGQKGEKGDPGPQGEKGEKGDKGDNGEVTYNYAHFNLSNALKGEKSGKTVLLDNISPLEHELKIKLTSDTVTDFSGVSVIRQSKNILPFPYSKEPMVSEGASVTVSDDGKVTFSGVLINSTSVALLTLYEGNALIGSGKITLGFGSKSEKVMYYFKLSDSSDKTLFLVNKAVSESLTVNLDDYPTATKWNIYISCANGTGSPLNVNETVYPQIETGETATEYQPYNQKNATADKDGNVKGIISVYPQMVLTTDNSAVSIDCEYAKDINKFSGNGGSVSVDQTYSAESENAQSGKALASVFQSKFELWKAKKDYKKGDTVIAWLYDAQYKNEYVVGMECIKDHTSPELSYPNMAGDFNECWGYKEVITKSSYSAVTDGEYNNIIDTYATKKELDNKQNAFALYDSEDDGWGRLRLKATDFEMLVEPGAKMSIGDFLSPIVIQKGTVDFNGARIVDVAAPTDNNDAATKKYVDDAVAAAGGGSTSNGTTGGSCEIDSVVGLSTVLQNKIEKWKSDTLYKVGDTVISEWKYDISGTTVIVNVLMTCKTEHTSPDKIYPNQDITLNEVRANWDFEYINSATAATAIGDGLGNAIHSTYATKAELENVNTAMGNINTILATVVDGGEL